MRNNEELFLDLPSASICLSENFPNDPKADLTLTFKNKQYKLQKSILKFSSKYFEKVLTEETKRFEVKNDCS